MSPELTTIVTVIVMIWLVSFRLARRRDDWHYNAVLTFLLAPFVPVFMRVKEIREEIALNKKLRDLDVTSQVEEKTWFELTYPGKHPYGDNDNE